MSSAAALTTNAGIVVAILLMATPIGEGRQRAVDLVFWARPGAEKDPRVVRTFEHHACSGRGAVARVQLIPHLTADRALEPEPVVEFSETGPITSRWGMPIDTVVVAVSGQRIMVPTGGGHAGAEALWISPDGGIEFTRIPVSAGAAEPFTCPKLDAFGETDYLRCHVYPDLASKRPRRIGYQMPCT